MKPESSSVHIMPHAPRAVRRLWGLLAVVPLAGLALLGGGRESVASQPELLPPPSFDVPADTLTLSVPIKAGTSFGELMTRHDAPTSSVRDAALDLYDLAMIRPDRELHLTWADGSRAPSGVRYRIDEDRTVVVTQLAEGEWSAQLEEVEYTGHTQGYALTIETSLWSAGLDAGLRPDDLVTLARIFEYEVDFNSELKAGASMELVTETLSAPGRRNRLGAIHAVRLRNGDKVHEAVRFEVDGKESWYHPDGKGMQRPFLRSPLEFNARVTSSFNPNRFHPVLKKRRPHNGTDFGAPSGTPVRTVASGTVVYAGRNGGYGNHVKVRHEGGYETSYSHLTKIYVRQGQKISQGTRVGTVGSTGLATGPHLHYEMKKNGRFIDAMKTSLPVSAPLPKSEMGAFQAQVAQWMPQLGQQQPEVLAQAEGEADGLQ